MPSTNIKLDFPDDKSREDFEIAFRGWLKQYQQQAGVARALTGGGGAQGGGGQGSTGGLTGSGGSHSYGGGSGGGGGSEQGLIRLGSGSAGPYSVSDFYLNIIGGW